MDCNKDTLYPSILFIFLFWLKVSSLFPVFQGLASECCRFYNILISTESKQPPPDASTSVDTSVFIGYPRPDEKKNCKKKTWAKYLKLSLSFSLFQDPDRKMRACGGRKAAFSTKVNWLFWETRQHYQSWPLFSSAVMALYWDPVPFISIGRFMKNKAMSAHGKDWTQPPVLDLSLCHCSVFGFKSSTRGRLSAFAF